jgi:ABC-type uncharacterized transport system substrate-binding protein
MKQFLFISFLLVTTISFSQSRNEKQVAIAVTQLTQAMESADSVMLDKLIDAELSYGHSGGRVENKRDFISNIVSGKSDFVKIILTNQQIIMHHKTAIIRHHLSATTNDSGKPGTVSLNIMLVWQKQHGHWKLIARQAVKAS